MPDLATKSTWTKVALADCCEEIGQRVENPAESGYDRFVGLEHLESGETSVRHWGSTDDVTSSMKLFKAGDVIVARRNVYLRRAARADFEGVCSGDGIVLRASGDPCLPELLPFLLNTNAFWEAPHGIRGHPATAGRSAAHCGGAQLLGGRGSSNCAC